MLDIPKQHLIYVAIKPVDMRISFGGLSALVHDVLTLNPIEGQLFVFRKKSGDKLKLLWWDRNGFVQYYKRLEKGRFKWPKLNGTKARLTSQELELLLDGVDLNRVKRLSPVVLSDII